MFNSTYFSPTYFPTNYFTNELIVGRPFDFFGPNIQTFIDMFNRADGAPGNNWTATPSNDVLIVNNELYLEFGNVSDTLENSCIQSAYLTASRYIAADIRFWDSTIYSDHNYWIYCSSWTDANNFVGLKIGVAPTTAFMYMKLIKRVSGVDTVLATYNSGQVYVTIARQRFMVVQTINQLDAYILSGSLASAQPILTAQGNYQMGGSWGFMGASSGGANLPVVDDVYADSVGSSRSPTSGAGRRRRSGSFGVAVNDLC